MGSRDAVSTGLELARCSIARGRRRRFHWAAWWTAEPTTQPFQKPDAHGGGAKSFEDARADAERVIGRSVVVIDSQWARAWASILQGEKPRFRPPRELRDPAPPPNAAKSPAIAWWRVLGVDRDAPLAAIRRAHRKLVLEHHPDRGGDAQTFRQIQAAYERAVARVASPVRRRR